MESGCVELDDQMNSDLLKIMDENTERVKSDFAENSFQRLFWEQQLKSTKVKDKRQMSWHPMIIKWCLHLKMLSSAAYHAFWTSGFITLPSKRTLRDCTHLARSAMGIQSDVNEQLQKAVTVKEGEQWWDIYQEGCQVFALPATRGHDILYSDWGEKILHTSVHCFDSYFRVLCTTAHVLLAYRKLSLF